MPTLPIRRCAVVASDRPTAVARLVSCPNLGHSIDAAACVRCAHVDSVCAEAVRCAPPIAPAERDPRQDLRERAVRTRVGDLMGARVVCAEANTSVAAAAALLVEHDLRCLPIVDAERKLVGIVTRADLLRERFLEADREVSAPADLCSGFHMEKPSSSVLEEVMTPRVHALPEDAPLTYAIALMAAEQVHEVPVVTHDGSLVGVLTALDALRWMAAELGYRLAPRARHNQTT